MTAPGEQPEERLERTGTQARSAAGKTQQDGSVQSQDWADVIGPNATDYYLEQFRRIQGGNRYSWHWPAFFVTLGWLFYRKLWLPALVYLVLLPLGLAGALSLATRVLGEHGIIVAYVLVFSLTFLLLPLFANRVYFAKVQRAVSRVDAGNYSDIERRERLSRAGGTHLLLAILTMLIPVVVTLVLIAASIPAYRDFAARSQVMEGLELAGRAQAAIADHYREHEVWPADNAAAGIAAAPDLRGRYVDSIAVDGGVIIVTYGQTGQRAIRGRRLILNPDADRLPAIEWICYSPDIPSRLLPAGCEAPDLR
jgi:Tfp pilus assembly major pilin PilA